MIARGINKKLLQEKARRTKLVSWLNYYSHQTNFNNQICSAYLNPCYKIIRNLFILQLICTPKLGIFADIEFKLQIIITLDSPLQPVKVYNNRRIFHPNIDIYTCQLLSQQMEKLPSNQFIEYFEPNMFDSLVRDVRKVIVWPNCYFVPNNSYNRKAAWHYFYNQRNYRDLIMENCPLALNKAVRGQYRDSRIILDYKKEQIIAEYIKQKKWSIKSTKARHQNDSYGDLKSIQLLKWQEIRIKKINVMDFQSDISECETVLDQL